MIPAGQTVEVPLKFHPLRRMTEEVMLYLSNLHSGTRHYYFLRGVGLAPLAEDTLALAVKMRERSHLTVDVHNASDFKQSFELYCDLKNKPVRVFLNEHGRQEVEVSPRSSKSVTVHVQALSSDFESFVVAFHSMVTNEVTWYRVEMTVEPGIPDGFLSAESSVGVPKTLRILLVNPVNDEDAEFEVEMDSNLFVGPKNIIIPCGQSVKYELDFLPGKNLKNISCFPPNPYYLLLVLPLLMNNINSISSGIGIVSLSWFSFAF
jgi:hypothetical protein